MRDDSAVARWVGAVMMRTERTPEECLCRQLQLPGSQLMSSLRCAHTPKDKSFLVLFLICQLFGVRSFATF